MSQIQIQHNPSQGELEELNVHSWPIWSKEVSEFPWEYDSTEVCYILEGRAVITPEDGQPVEIKAKDLVTFPTGMACVWKIIEDIRKHYTFR